MWELSKQHCTAGSLPTLVPAAARRAMIRAVRMIPPRTAVLRYCKSLVGFFVFERWRPTRIAGVCVIWFCCVGQTPRPFLEQILHLQQYTPQCSFESLTRAPPNLILAAVRSKARLSFVRAVARNRLAKTRSCVETLFIMALKAVRQAVTSNARFSWMASETDNRHSAEHGTV